MAFLATTVTSSSSFSLIDKREESLRKKLKYPIKVLRGTASKEVLSSLVVGTASALGWERNSGLTRGMAEQRVRLLNREETLPLSD